MRRANFHVSLGLCLLVAACADGPPPEAPSVDPVDPPRPNEDLAAMLAGSPSASQAGPEKANADAKKAEEQRQLAADFEKLDKDLAAEKARFTDAVRKDLSALSQKDFPSFKAALEASLTGSHRSPGARDRDKERHPVEMLTFFGLRQDMSVLELDAGAGWYTEVLAPVLKKRGKLTVSGPSPDGPTTERSTFYGKRLRGLLDKAPELGDKVDYLVVDPAQGFAFSSVKDGTFDAVLAFRALHGWQRRNVLEKNLAELFRVLKPGGVLAIEAHRAKPDADPKQSAEKGYLPEAYVVKKAEEAGFLLEKKSELNANPKDTKDHPDGVWSLPPTLRGGDKDRDKYLAIGESDRMTLKLVKPKKK